METTFDYKIGVLSVYRGKVIENEFDRSSLFVKEYLVSVNHFKNAEIIQSSVFQVVSEVENILKRWSDNQRLDLILIIAGTSLIREDVVVQATRSLIDKELFEIEAIMASSFQIFAPTHVNRFICGIRNRTVILNLPRCIAGSEMCLDALFPALVLEVKKLQFAQDGSDCSKGHICEYAAIQSKVRVDNVVQRPRKSQYEMISVPRAVQLILENTSRLGDIKVHLKRSFNFVLANDVIAIESHPPFHSSMKDGYAVVADDDSVIRNVIGSITAGHLPDYKVVPGSCVRISTGCPIPDGANAIVQIEDTEIVQVDDEAKNELQVKILEMPKLGQDIRAAGSDISVGEILVSAKKLITPSDIGLLASAGVHNVSVYAKPVVAVLATGDEITNGDGVLPPGCVRESNSICLMFLLRKHYIPALDIGIAKDRPNIIKMLLSMALHLADVVITTGGVSMGEKDILKQVLIEDFNAVIHFGRVFMKPGKPTTFSTLNFDSKKKCVFSLPGNAVSSYVGFHVFVLPCIRKMMGMKETSLVVKSQLCHDIQLDDRPEYHRASVTYDVNNSCFVASSTGSQQSSRLKSMTHANALLQLPPRSPEQMSISTGSFVETMLIDDISI